MPSRDNPRPSRGSSQAAMDTHKSQPPQDRTAKNEPKQKTLMDRWVEPAMSEAQPSYQDHNGSAYGVVEHMQPLGEAPNAKVKSRVKTEAPRKSVLGRSSAAAGMDAQETPEGTPVPQTAPITDADGPVQPSQPPVVIDDEKDTDYAPGGKKKERTSRPRAGKRNSETAPPKKSKRKRKYTAKALKDVVEIAKGRAYASGNPDLAEAVHEIWVESLQSARLTDLLEAILERSADPEQTKEFQEHVKAVKRRLRDNKKNVERVTPEGSAIGSQSLPLRSPAKFTRTSPKPKADTDALPSTEPTDAPKPKLSLKVKSPFKDPKERRRAGHGSKMSTSPQKKKDAGYESDSSLTDLTENDDDGMDVDDHDKLAAGPGTPTYQVNGIKAKDHAAERGSLAAPDRKFKRTSADAELEDDERERDITAKKQKLSKTVNREYPYEESDIREPVKATAARSRTSRTQNNSLVPPSLSLQPNGGRGGSTKGSRAVSAELDSPLSELSPSSSRMSTPRMAKGLHKPPPGKKAKTKNSPEKKQVAGYGGLAGAGGAGTDSPIGDDDNEELSENNDFCSACGASGFLLCCDGCDRSFHFSCLDPPLNDQASELNEPWYCFICVAKRPISAESPEKPARGLFAPLLTSLKKRNPSNFVLPDNVRNYYEGVHTDKSGNYTEAVAGKTRARSGYDEIPDYTKLRDSKGNTVLCYYCGKSSLDKRQIIQCDYCSQNWHLDCLDPPLANPPARTYENKKLHDWMCPLHADHELNKVDATRLVPRRRIHLRRPKDARVVDTSLRRGFLNNGIIDIADDESDETDSEFYENEHEDEGVVYRLPSSGIKLDFIDKVKKYGVNTTALPLFTSLTRHSKRMKQALAQEQAYKRMRLAEPSPAPSALQQANFSKRSFVEKQLALQLAQFAGANTDLALGTDQVENLVGALIAEAPPEVVDEYMADETAKSSSQAQSAVPPSPPSSDQTDQLSAEQRRELQMLQELIRRRLEGAKS